MSAILQVLQNVASDKCKTSRVVVISWAQLFESRFSTQPKVLPYTRKFSPVKLFAKPIVCNISPANRTRYPTGSTCSTGWILARKNFTNDMNWRKFQWNMLLIRCRSDMGTPAKWAPQDSKLLVKQSSRRPPLASFRTQGCLCTCDSACSTW